MGNNRTFAVLIRDNESEGPNYSPFRHVADHECYIDAVRAAYALTGSPFIAFSTASISLPKVGCFACFRGTTQAGRYEVLIVLGSDYTQAILRAVDAAAKDHK